MKKLLLTTAAIAAFCASTTSYGSEDSEFFMSANTGWSKTATVQEYKSNNDMYLGLGFGYYINPNIRMSLVFDHFLKPTHKKTQANKTSTAKGTINTLLLNGFVDAFKAESFKLFVGAGVGAGQVKTKLTIEGHDESLEYKNQIGLAFAVYVGASYELTDGVIGEVSYSYRGLGKGKTPTDYKDFDYTGNHIGAGIRFNL